MFIENYAVYICSVLGTRRRSTCNHQIISAEQPQLVRTKQRERKREKHRFNEVRKLPTSSQQKRRDLINQSIQVIKYVDNTPPYISKESTKKKNQQI